MQRPRAWRGPIALLALGTLLGVVAISSAALGGEGTGHKSSACVPMPGGRLFGAQYAPTEVTVIGDSLSTGLMTSPALSWPSVLAQSLNGEGNNVCVRSLAENGAGFTQAGDDGHTFLFQARQVPLNAAVVLIYGSDNDRDVPLAELHQRVGMVAQRVRQSAPAARLVFVGPLETPAGQSPELLELRDEIGATVQQMGIPFVDPIDQGWLMDRPDLFFISDVEHPSVEGHRHLAGNFEKILRSSIALDGAATVFSPPQ